MIDKSPRRIQRMRAKGWNMPLDTVYVGRPSKWGNPFTIGGWFSINRIDSKTGLRFLYLQSYQPNESGYVLVDSKQKAFDMYCDMVNWNYDHYAKFAQPLRGKNLACWCALEQPCHADVLLELANS